MLDERYDLKGYDPYLDSQVFASTVKGLCSRPTSLATTIAVSRYIKESGPRIMGALC